MNFDLELHPLCTLFPRITGPEFEALKADIAANGLRQPIVVHNGMILDGGNRYRACKEIGARYECVEFVGSDIVSFVLSANLHRRHLSPGQQAAIVATAQDWSKANIQGRNTITGNVAGDTVADRAAQSGASERTQRMADKVAKEAPELAKKVAHGEISLPKAVEQISERKPVSAVPQAREHVSAPAQPSELDQLREQVAELQAALKEALADNETMGRVFDSDDRLKAAMEEVQRWKAIAASAERTLAAKSAEFVARAKQVTYWQNRAQKAEKELAKAAA